MPKARDPQGGLFADFDGATYERERDHARLRRQLDRVRAVMADGRWRHLTAIALRTGSPEASVSARLRDLRKPKFGALTVERRYDQTLRMWEYRVVHPTTEAVENR